MLDKDLEIKFQQILCEQIAKGEKACGKGCPQLMAQIEKTGGVQAVKGMLKRGRQSENFDELHKSGKLEFSVETLPAKSDFTALFTDEEVNFCLAALCESGYYG